MTLFLGGGHFCSEMNFTAIVFGTTRNMIADVALNQMTRKIEVLHLFALLFLQQVQLKADLHK